MFFKYVLKYVDVLKVVLEMIKWLQAVPYKVLNKAVMWLLSFRV